MSRLVVQLVAAAAVAISCIALPPPWQGLVAPISTDQRHPYSLRIESGGLREPDWRHPSPISNDDFGSALAQSLVRSELFAKVTLSGKTDYLLDVYIHLTRPPYGEFEPTVHAEAKWTLIELASGKAVFEEVIRSSRTTSPRDSRARQYADRGRALGVVCDQLCVAREEAVKENIRSGIRRLAELDFGALAEPSQAAAP